MGQVPSTASTVPDAGLGITPEVIVAAEGFVAGELAGADASHDWAHIQRVRANARHLAREEGLSAERTALCDLAALLHDVRDWKYSGSDSATAEAVQAFLSGQGVGPQGVAAVLSIIATVGFKEELPATKSGAYGRQAAKSGGGAAPATAAAPAGDAHPVPTPVVATAAADGAVAPAVAAAAADCDAAPPSAPATAVAAAEPAVAAAAAEAAAPAPVPAAAATDGAAGEGAAAPAAAPAAAAAPAPAAAVAPAAPAAQSEPSGGAGASATQSAAAAAGRRSGGLSLEASIVQDADRLDAIGAIGIARCFTFGGAKHRVLHDPSLLPRDGLTKEAYMVGGAQSTTINHFYEKLLKLKGLMKTSSGAALAAKRHAFMEAFLAQFHDEWAGRT